MTLPNVLIPIRMPGGDFHIAEAAPSELDWPELRTRWSEAGSARPICFAPPEEKLDLFFSYACQKAGMPISLGTVFNLGWTEMFLDRIQHDCLVISSRLVRYLSERHLFADHLERLKLIVVVGYAPVEDKTATETLTANHTLRMLPHPARALTS